MEPRAAPRPPAVRLVVGLLAADEAMRLRAVDALAGRFGPLCSLSAALPFEAGYYGPEMGPGLSRRVAAFQRLVRPHDLEAAKLACIELEDGLARDGKRTVNIDPGLLSAGSLILATHKHAPHRLPLGRGLYCELTLFYCDGRFQAQPWTYPDYASAEMLELLEALRRRYLWRLRSPASGQGAAN